MSEALVLLKAMALAIGHTSTCTTLTGPPCSCGKVALLTLAHGEACSLLRREGLIR